MNKNWRGIMKVLEVRHIRNNKVIWEDCDLYNMLHAEGQEILLNAVFAGGSIPSSYYLGLDNRSSLAVTDNLADLLTEPSTNGYTRFTASASSDFTISSDISGNFKSQSVLLTFIAAGGSWGPVKNLFMSSSLDNAGKLISSVALSEALTLVDGDIINLRINLSLTDC
jgi:hypothetical protein